MSALEWAYIRVRVNYCGLHVSYWKGFKTSGFSDECGVLFIIIGYQRFGCGSRNLIPVNLF